MVTAFSTVWSLGMVTSKSGTAATPEAAGADIDVNHAKCTQHQGGCHASEEAEPELRGRMSPSNPHTVDTAWKAVLQHSMRLARDTKCTHKGLQASAASCLVIMNEEHVHDCTFAHHLFNPMVTCCKDVCCSLQHVTQSGVLASFLLSCVVSWDFAPKLTMYDSSPIEMCASTPQLPQHAFALQRNTVTCHCAADSIEW